MNIKIADRYCKTHFCEDCIVKSLFSKELLEQCNCFALLASIDRIFNIKYIIDDGEKWERRNCFIRAIDAESAFDTFHKDIEAKLVGNEFIVNGYTKISECENPVIVDINTMDDERELYYV